MSDTILAGDWSYLNEYIEKRNCKTQQPAWLENSFELDVWKCNFNSAGKLEIDFNIQLNDGALLTSNKHRRLLTMFKSWISIQTHPTATKRSIIKDVTGRRRVIYVLQIIDYLILNSEKLMLDSFGLQLFNRNECENLLQTLSSKNNKVTSLYKFDDLLKAYLSELVATTCASDSTGSLSKIESINGYQAFHFLNEEDNLKVHHALIEKNFIILKKDNLIFKTVDLARHILKNTLYGRYLTTPPLHPVRPRDRELNAAPVRNTHEKLDIKQARRFLDALKSILLLVPNYPDDLSGMFYTLRGIDLSDFEWSTAGRYKNVPTDVLFTSLGQSIELFLNYGKDILQSVVRVLTRSRRLGIQPMGCCLDSFELEGVSQKLLDLGVLTWGHGIDKATKNDESVHNIRRQHRSLWHLQVVLFGAIQLTIGALTARRQAELLKLQPGKIIDELRDAIYFFNMKSGSGEFRQIERRPLIEIGIQMIEALEDFHRSLLNECLINSLPINIFSYINRNGSKSTKCRHSQYNRCMDLFCDYSQIDANNSGQRYYLRQHQLRRFFAMAFFWGEAKGGAEALRWFLAQTDPMHLYNYITETTPGNILSSVKAEYAAHLLQAGKIGNNKFVEFVSLHFNTYEFSLIDSEELVDYIESAMDAGFVRVEPQFFDVGQNETYTVLVTMEK